MLVIVRVMGNIKLYSAFNGKRMTQSHTYVSKIPTPLTRARAKFMQNHATIIYITPTNVTKMHNIIAKCLCEIDKGIDKKMLVMAMTQMQTITQLR